MDDLISRQAAIDEIDEWIKAFRESGHKESAADACFIQDGIIHLPSAQPETNCSEIPNNLDLISKLSEIRSQYNCFDEAERSYYHALSEAIKVLSGRADEDTISRQAAIDEIE